MCRTEEIIAQNINRKPLIENEDHELIYSQVLTKLLTDEA
jgi:hypothetical protein